MCNILSCQTANPDILLSLLAMLVMLVPALVITLKIVDTIRDWAAERAYGRAVPATEAWRAQAELARVLHRHAAEYEAYRREAAYRAALAYVRG